MEARFGQDFGRVRVHTGPQAEQSATDLAARAWTSGHDIFFGTGTYAPSTPRGAGLIAHELAHVIQQRGATRQAGAPEIARPGDVFEREADAAAAAVAAGARPRPFASARPPHVQPSFLSTLLDVLLFIPRLFGLEVFPAEDLRDYLKSLKEKKGPVGGVFSDNKARACVARENEFGPYDTDTKTWLVQEMATGHVSFLDEGAIIALLRRSADRPQIVAAVGRDWLWSKFGGQNRRVIEALTMTAADAGDALVARLRDLSPEQIQEFAANAVDPAVRESARRAAALASITAPVPVQAAISGAGVATLEINSVQVTVLPDQINPSLGKHALTHGDFQVAHPSPIAITPENQNLPVNMGPDPPIVVSLTIYTEFPSEEAKSSPSGYGVGTRPGDQPTLRFHERAHGEAWFTFLRNNPPPVFKGANGMLPAQFNAAVEQWNADFRAYSERAELFTLQAGDCVGTLPTEEQYAGTGFHAAICHQQ